MIVPAQDTREYRGNLTLIENKVRKIIAEELDIDLKEVILKANFTKDLGADSLDLLELMMLLEEEFGIKISDDTAAELLTVKDVIEYIKKQSHYTTV